jgi:hypothetical protein
VFADSFSGQTVDIESGNVTVPIYALGASVNGSLTVQMTNGQLVFGRASFSGTLNLTLPNGVIPTLGSQYQPFDILQIPHYTITNTFGAVNLPALSPGISWDTSNLYTTGYVDVVPEPATTGLLLAGSATILRRRRRRGREPT